MQAVAVEVQVLLSQWVQAVLEVAVQDQTPTMMPQQVLPTQVVVVVEPEMIQTPQE
jgi:hypothetical protein